MNASRINAMLRDLRDPFGDIQDHRRTMEEAARLIEELMFDLNELPTTISMAQDAAVSAVYEQLTKPHEVVGAIDSDLPLCRVAYMVEDGDPSVGLSGWAGFVEADDQTGTELARLRAALVAAHLAGWREAKKQAGKAMDELRDSDNLVNDDLMWIRGYETACSDGAKAIRSLPDPEEKVDG